MKGKELIEALGDNIEILFAFVGSMDNERIMEKRKGNYWSVYEHIRHLSQTQDMLYRRLEQFIHDDSPSILPFSPVEQSEPESGDPKPICEHMRNFELWRNKQIELIKRAEASVWTKEANHPEYEKYTFEILIRHILIHDSFHMYRMEELWILKDEFLEKA
jgi:hypothetical protein